MVAFDEGAATDTTAAAEDTTTSTEAREIRTVTIVSGPNPYLLQPWAAQESGIFADHGLELEVIQTQSAGASFAGSCAR